MEANSKDLKHRYESMTADELLYIKSSSDLTDAASIALEEVLSTHDVKDSDHVNAVNSVKYLVSKRDSVRRKVRRFFKLQLVYYVFIGIVGLVILFVKY